ncbi:COP9 signalosome catalytic subunit rri1 [Didymella pomorum]|uniref:COP9 signalosome complex subunit 5 n=1 Tax=Didymella pomorum TaxID=749634 RepID=A0A9W8ZC85_9PLEO|nr:COP9 signalosome catalytic subunit rri1 [Didymella pomorum]
MGTALKTWELENSVQLVDPTKDALYSYSVPAQKALDAAHPWRTDPHYFTSVRISAVALLKMVMHARSGGSLEVMGLMMGKIEAHTFVVTDAFRLPVEGTETRVNAQDEANEYMVEFLQRARDQGQLDNAVGWYHSHPGYGCWLSGIDVNTQKTQQQFSDPFCAVVIDPDRTVSAGKVEIGGFRTFPDSYVTDKEKGGSTMKNGGAGVESDGFQTIPLGKIEDFGAHANHYYPLEVSHYKSTLDAKLLEALWNKYWVQTLSASPLMTNREYGTKQISDLARKITQETGKKGFKGAPMMGVGEKKDPLPKLGKAGSKIAREEEMGLLAARVKDQVFNFNGSEKAAVEQSAKSQEVQSQEVEMKS